jgi:dTMP kinase
MKKKGIDYIVTREPGGTLIGEEIRGIILDNKHTKMGSETEALLYAAARSQHVHEKIKPALNDGKIVICDRFVLSSLAYQGVGRDLGIERVKMVNDFGLGGLYPDLILFFHVDPEVTLSRKTDKLGGDRLEKEGNDYHKKVYNGYMELIKRYSSNISIIDATKSIEDVYAQCIGEIEKVL